MENRKRYIVANKFKKSFIEVERFSNSNNGAVYVETGWRGGQVVVFPNYEEEQRLLNWPDDEELCITDEFADWEFDASWDGCWMDFRYVNVDENLKKLLEDEDNDWYEVLEDHGFLPADLYLTIVGGVDVTEL